jgi:hypothetical protein
MKRREPSGQGRDAGRGVSLTDLITAGLLAPLVTLFRRYKGKRVEAVLLADGAVEFRDQRYRTCSAAAEAARMSVTGQRQNTNGWVFWQFQGVDGKTLTLADARQQLTSGKSVGGQEQAEDQAERHDLRKRFWVGLLSRPKLQGTRHAGLSPVLYGWIGAGSGVRGLPFIYAVKQHEARVEVFIDRGAGTTAENKEIFDSLHKHKAVVEKTFGAALSWQRLDGKQGSRIAYDLTVGGYKSEEAKWPAIQDAMIDAMLRLEAALGPHLDKLRTELAS